MAPSAIGSEQELLSYYNLTTLDPNQWPSSKNTGEEEDDDPTPAARQAKAKHQKRYTTLGGIPRAPALNNELPPLPNSKSGTSPSIPKDEADPITGASSVIALLRARHLPVDHDPELRNQFLLSSPTFSPNLYLSKVHNTASTNDLLRGLDNLTASIDKKSASLKALVEANFERFVRAKSTVDSVYTEMRDHGGDGTSSLVRPRSSRSGTSHFRKISNQQAQAALEKRKNAIVPDSEYGTIGIRRPIVEATARAQDIWSPALGGREREDHLKSVLASIDQHKSIFEVGSSLEDCIKRRDYEKLTEEYTRAQRLRREAQTLASRARENNVNISDQHLHQILITGRVLMDVDARIEDFKRETWRRLTSPKTNSGLPASDGQQDEYMELIAILMQLGVEENPIMVWLHSRHEHLRVRTLNSFERLRRDLEVQRRRLGIGDKPSDKVLATHLQAAETGRKNNEKEMDTQQVIRFWEKETSSLSSLLSSKGGMLGELLEFWETAQAFIEGMRQRSLPIGIDGRSRAHHRLNSENVKDLRRGAIELFGLVRDQLYAIFAEAPLEDISALFSPNSPVPKTPMSATMSPIKATRFTFNPKDVPPPLPGNGQLWDKYAFWPPHSNSLSAVSYLSKINNVIGTAAAEMASVDLVKQESRLVHQLRTLVGDVRERSITAICAAWQVDSENCRELEDWTRSTERPELTNLPARFSAFETALLSSLQKIVYIPEAANHPGSPEVILPPPARHIETVQRGYKTSLFKAFAGMIEHASMSHSGKENLADTTDITVPLLREQSLESNGEAIDATSNNARKLLTLSNLNALRSDIIPALASTFETHFLLTIGDDVKLARDVLHQMHDRIFKSYARPCLETIRNLVTAGITASNYAPDDGASGSTAASARPNDARPYVYDALLQLVLTHTEVSRTAPAQTTQTLSYLLEQLSLTLIEAFKRRPRYSLAALMQATLDVEFLAQTLDNYTTKKAGEVQGEIYQALDERTSNEARARLQEGLPEMKSILKRLRERTRGEFGCFRRERRKRGAAGGAVGGQQGAGEGREQQ